MPIPSAVQDLVPDAQTWRRDIHQNPELLYDVERTAKYVADRLTAFGCDEVKTAIGRTGVVGVIRGAKGGRARAIALRADMDALPIEEATNLPYRSRIPGKMHACGHDGHTAMLLGAARRLAETRNFAGNAVVIFQPAEEGGGGAKAMLDDGLMDRFGVEEVYGMHNWPSLPVGSFMLRKGALMAAADEITITIEGRGGHAAMPHQSVDPVVLGAQIVLALQTIASRNLDPLDACVVSVTQFHAGATNNVIPNRLGSTARRARSNPERAIWSRDESARSPPVLLRPPAPRPGSNTAATTRRPSITRRRPTSPRKSRARSQAIPKWIRTPPRSWARKTFRSCSRRARARSSSSATATAPSSITRLMTSMTQPSPMA
jgi:metal-dependent amidase/aminoacylase/carboxypeptidase family protein